MQEDLFFIHLVFAKVFTCFDGKIIQILFASKKIDLKGTILYNTVTFRIYYIHPIPTMPVFWTGKDCLFFLYVNNLNFGFLFNLYRLRHELAKLNGFIGCPAQSLVVPVRIH